MGRFLELKKPIKVLATSILVLLLTSILSAPLMPTVQAAEPNLQAKSISILTDVVGLKTEQYTVSKSIQQDEKLLDAQQKIVDMHLTSVDGSVRVLCTYVKDTLQMLYVSEIEGALKIKQSENSTVDQAKELLTNYQADSGKAVYGDFASMLNGIVEGENTAKVAGDVKLEVSWPQQNTASYVWTYVDANGVVAEKKNVILTYERGVFRAFYNNWALYTIAGTVPKVSAQQATDLAVEASKNFTYTVTDTNGSKQTVSGFSIAPASLGNTKLVYVNSRAQESARGGDPYELYLAWYVPLGFDRFYPGDVSGLTVILWADTGEVCGLNRVIVDSGFASSLVEDVGEDIGQTLQSQSSITQQVAVPSQVIGLSAVVGWLGKDYTPLI
jgi:hypothetical protein